MTHLPPKGGYNWPVMDWSDPERWPFAWSNHTDIRKLSTLKMNFSAGLGTYITVWWRVRHKPWLVQPWLSSVRHSITVWSNHLYPQTVISTNQKPQTMIGPTIYIHKPQTLFVRPRLVANSPATGLFEEQRICRGLLLTEAIVWRLLEAFQPTCGMSWKTGLPQIIQKNHSFETQRFWGIFTFRNLHINQHPQLRFISIPLLVQSLEL